MNSRMSGFDSRHFAFEGKDGVSASWRCSLPLDQRNARPIKKFTVILKLTLADRRRVSKITLLILKSVA